VKLLDNRLEVYAMTSAQEFSKAVKAFYDKEQKLPKEEQVARAKARLMNEGIIDEKGEFTDNYIYSREYYKHVKAE
jgi:hypothetical protein